MEKLAVYLFLITTFTFSQAWGYSGGTGTPEDPYQIATAADLILLGETPNDYDKHFIMTADIDLDPNLPRGKVFDRAVLAPDTHPGEKSSDYEGIPFAGVFDGNGHTILNVTIKGESFLGLFGRLYGTVKDLGITSAQIAGSGDYIGTLVGHNYGYVTRCYSTGMVDGGCYVGGLVGCVGRFYMSMIVNMEGDSTIDVYAYVTSCYSNTTVSGNVSVGGLVGENQNGAVMHCYSMGTVTGDIENVGGLVGCLSDLSEVTYCYNTGKVYGPDQLPDEASLWAQCISGLVGDSQGRVMHCVWDMDTSGLSGSHDGVGLTTAEMMDAYMLGLNGFADDPNWILDFGHDYPRLAWEGTVGKIILEPNIDWLAGQGTREAPYGIAAADQLIMLGKASALWDKQFVLTAHINLDPNLPGGQVFGQAVIPAFSGVFHGEGHTISNLTIKGGGYLGLFGRLEPEAQVQQLGIVHLHITGVSNNVGGLVGENRGGYVSRCFSTGWVSSTGVSHARSVGGLVGSNCNGGTLTESFSECTVWGDERAGGLIGSSNGYAYLRYCYSTGSVSGNECVGGLIGDNSGHVAHCFSIGMVNGSSYVGGLTGIGNLNKDCFWDIQTSGSTRGHGGTGLTTSEMQEIQTYLDARWDFVGEMSNGAHEIWKMPQGGGYPVLAILDGYTPPQFQGAGTSENPYLIKNAAELGAMIRYSDYAHYQLTASIDLSSIRWTTAVIPRFSGVFDGNGFMIEGLYIQGNQYLGLFGQVSEATISNLSLEAVDVNGISGYVGSLAGSNIGSSVTQCYSSGVVSGGSYVGGMIGDSQEGSMLDCHSIGSVSGGQYVGGLIGVNSDNIKKCYSSGVVSGRNIVGGLVGEHRGSDLSDSHSQCTVICDMYYGGGLVGKNFGEVSSCHSTSTVNGGYKVGGLAGYNNGAVYRSYSCGIVSGRETVGGLIGSNVGVNSSIVASYNMGIVSGQYGVGGLVGYNGGNCYVIQSYNLGAVRGTGEPYQQKRIGGLLGDNQGFVSHSYSVGGVSGTGETMGGLIGSSGSDSFPAGCFWDTQASDQLTSAGGIGKTTTEMQTKTTFLAAGWDFMDETDNGAEDIWWILTGQGYPRLWWENIPSEIFYPHLSDSVTGHGVPDDPFLIYTAEQLNAINLFPCEWNKHFKLMSDIDLSGYSYDRALIPSFSGTFDGNGYAINNLTLAGDNLLGLIGTLEKTGRVLNLGVIGTNINGTGDYIGSLVGRNEGNVADCYSAGTVIGNEFVGGLVGYNDGNIVECSSSGTVNGNHDIGGLMGYNCGTVTTSHSSADSITTGNGYAVGGLVAINIGHILNCYSTGLVSGNDPVGGLVGSNVGIISESYSSSVVTGEQRVGGLAGMNILGGSISMSYSIGTVVGSGISNRHDSGVGGLVGTLYWDSSVTTSYSTGSVTGDRNVGGLVGQIQMEGTTLAMCYSTAVVTGNENVGGLVGFNRHLGYTNITSSFWDMETSGLLNSDGGTGLTTAEMQTATTYLESGWDFIDETDNGTDDIWWIDEGQDYPRLWWEQ
jgi:hypothetical protein